MNCTTLPPCDATSRSRIASDRDRRTDAPHDGCGPAGSPVSCGPCSPRIPLGLAYLVAPETGSSQVVDRRVRWVPCGRRTRSPGAVSSPRVARGIGSLRDVAHPARGAAATPGRTREARGSVSSCCTASAECRHHRGQSRSGTLSASVAMRLSDLLAESDADTAVAEEIRALHSFTERAALDLDAAPLAAGYCPPCGDRAHRPPSAAMWCACPS